MKIFIPSLTLVESGQHRFAVRSIPISAEKHSSILATAQKLADDNVPLPERLDIQARLIRDAVAWYYAGDSDEKQTDIDKALADEIIDVFTANKILESYISFSVWTTPLVETDTVLQCYPLGFGTRSKRISELLDTIHSKFSNDELASHIDKDIEQVLIELIALCCKESVDRIKVFAAEEKIDLQVMHRCLLGLSSEDEKKMTT